MLAMVWRIWTLNARCLWFDEAFTWRLTRFPWREMIERAQADVHPPLYYIFFKPWVWLFGESVFAMRFFSVLWFGISLAGAYLLCQEDRRASSDKSPAEDGDRTARDRDAGLIAVLLLSSSPLVFRYSQEARMYTQEIGLVLITSWLLLRALREKARPLAWWSAYAAMSAALAYTHYFALFSIAAQFGFAAGRLLLKREPGGLMRSRTAWGALGAAVFTVVLYLPWIPTLLLQQSRVRDDYWAQSVDILSPLDLEFWRGIVLSSFIHNFANLESPFEDSFTLSIISYGLMAAVGLLLGLLARRRDRIGWYLIMGITVPVDLAIVKSLAVNRNLIGYRYLLPSYVLILVGLGLVIGRVRSTKLRWLLATVAAGNLAFLTYQYQQSLGLPMRSDLQGAADSIAAHQEPNDLVVCTEPMDFFPMKYHALGRFAVHQALYPELVIKHYSGGPILQKSDFLDWQDVVQKGDRRVWMVSRRFDLWPRATPVGWERRERFRFDEPIRFRGPIVVYLWQRMSVQRDRPVVPADGSATTFDDRHVRESGVTQIRTDP